MTVPLLPSPALLSDVPFSWGKTVSLGFPSYRFETAPISLGPYVQLRQIYDPERALNPLSNRHL